MEKEYAQALLQTGSVIKVNDHLVRTGRAGLWPRIAKALSRLSQEQIRRNRVAIVVARESDAKKAQEAAEKSISVLRSGHDRSVITFSTVIDESLIGGWRLEGYETLIDASYKKQLLNLYNSVTTQ